MTFALGSLVIAAVVAACAQYYTAASTPRPAALPRVPLADIADTLFWRTLHAGEYDSIQRALVVMKAAYLQNPTDSRTAAHVAFLHAWRIAERARVARMSPVITDDIILARRYFDQSVLYEPTYDARIHGFGAVFRMVEGDLHRDPALWEQGLRDGRLSIAAWPEFNWFSIGYALSARPESSPYFQEGLEMQWKTVESCGRTKVDRTNPTPEIALAALRTETDPLRKRACTNTWVAPHNVQGFFLNMGDMVTKSVDWRTAQKVYRLAEAADGYTEWKYQSVLQDRIRDAEQNVAEFRKDNSAMMFRSKFACAACHQAK
jgi:hypothetical protein